jgi:hypothetical protein
MQEPNFAEQLRVNEQINNLRNDAIFWRGIAIASWVILAGIVIYRAWK